MITADLFVIVIYINPLGKCTSYTQLISRFPSLAELISSGL